MPTFARRVGQAPATRAPAVALFGLVLAVVTLAGCGSSPTQPPSISVGPSLPPSLVPSPPASASPETTESATPSGSAPLVDACALLPMADLSEIVGGPPLVATAMPGGGWVTGQCAWNGPSSGFFLSVGTAASISAFSDPAAADAKAKLAQFTKTAADSATDVAGIGDGAVLGPSGMAAYVGGTYLEITRLVVTNDQLVEIMKLAIANL